MSPPAASTKRRVLVMDDDRLVRAAFVRGLSRHYDLVEAGSAEEALEILKNGEAAGLKFDVIVADLTLPGMDGMSFFDELREHHPSLSKRVLFVTGGSTSSRAEQFLRKTQNEVLYKPVMHERLRQAIESVAAAADAAPEA
jgi:two-component system response regulator GlrR